MAIFDTEESIYNILPPKVIASTKPPMHRSKHRGNLPPTASTLGQSGSTLPMVTNLSGNSDKTFDRRRDRSMGKAPGSYAPDTQSWLKKKTRSSSVPSLPQIKRDHPELLQPSKLKSKNKPKIPNKDDQPIMNLVSSKNFIVANAVEVILAAPKRRNSASKDYLHKEDYGQVPKYLESIRQDIAAEYEYISQMHQKEESPVRLMTEEEKQVLIQGLKAKWESVNHEYQAITHITKLDTAGKIKRKEGMEAELGQIEKDIERLSKKAIYVDRDS
jgi:hypothetical protein